LRFGDEISPDARSLLTGLLTRDPQQRLGVTGAESIRTHPFFAKHIDFKKLMQKKIQPPFKPSVESAADTSNVRPHCLAPPLLLPVQLAVADCSRFPALQFDTEFTSEAPQDSVVEDSHLSETVQQQFVGFSCVPSLPSYTRTFASCADSPTPCRYVQPAGAFGESVR